MSKELGGGSITAMPVIETMGGNISAYIPTNVISITDGQIYLETELFHSGVRPAVNTGLSVSRVGRSAQHKAMQRVSGSLRIELSQYREMAVFTRFGSDVDDSTARLLNRGHILTELLKQKKSKPYSLFEEVALLFAYRNSIFDGIPESDIKPCTEKMLDYLHTNCTAAENAVKATGDLSDESAERLKEALNLFKESYLNGEHK